MLVTCKAGHDPVLWEVEVYGFHCWYCGKDVRAPTVALQSRVRG
jgi:hypothetical protein